MLQKTVAHLDSAAVRDVIVALTEARPFNSAIAAPGVVEAAMIGPADPAKMPPPASSAGGTAS